MATNPLFQGKGVQAKGLTANYDFEAENVHLTNKIFWLDSDSNGRCETHNIRNFKAMGFCRHEGDGGVTICINFGEIETRVDDYNDFVLSFSAIDYHELSHAFFNIKWPIEDYEPREGYGKEQVFKALNYLVDQRDENWWLNEYPRTENYLQYLAMHPNLIKGLGNALVDSTKMTEEEAQKERERVDKYQAASLLLAWGRRFYLPDVYIKKLMESFANTYSTEALEAIQDVIDRFLYTTTFEEQEPLVYEFIDILRENQVECGLGTGDDDLDDDWGTIEVDMDTFKDMMKNGGTQSGGGAGAKKIKVKIKGCPMSGGGESEGEEDGENEEQNEEGEEGTGNGEEEGQGQSEGEGEEEEAGSGDDIDEMGDLGENNNIPAPRPETFEQLKKRMKNEADRSAKNIRQNAMQAGVQSSNEIGDPFKPSKLALNLKKNLESVFKKARTDMGSHHVRKLKRGVLDVNRAKTASRTGDNKIFRKFKPSKIKKMRMAVALILDQSGSMNSATNTMGVSNIQAATDMTWAVAAALHNFDGVTAVIGFDTLGKKMKEFEGRMEDWYLKADGGTNPGSSFEVIAEDFKPYLKQKLPCLAITVTDGIWYGNDGKKGIKKLNNMGIKTVEFLITNGYQVDPHGCQYTHEIDHLSKCSGHIEKIINDIQMETRRKLGG